MIAHSTYIISLLQYRFANTLFYDAYSAAAPTTIQVPFHAYSPTSLAQSPNGQDTQHQAAFPPELFPASLKHLLDSDLVRQRGDYVQLLLLRYLTAAVLYISPLRESSMRRDFLGTPNGSFVVDFW